MNSKTVPVSVRLSHEDAEFLSSLKINGAKTPSDKLRAIISEKRKKSNSVKDYQNSFQEIQSFMITAIEKVRSSEVNNKMHSEIVTRSFEWFPDLIALIVSQSLEIEDEATSEELIELEKGIIDRIYRITESVLQMGTTKWLHSYCPENIAIRSEPVLELCQLLKNLIKK